MLKLLFGWLSRLVRNAILTGTVEGIQILSDSSLGRDEQGRFSPALVVDQIQAAIGQPIQIADVEPVVVELDNQQDVSALTIDEEPKPRKKRGKSKIAG